MHNTRFLSVFGLFLPLSTSLWNSVLLLPNFTSRSLSPALYVCAACFAPLFVIAPGSGYGHSTWKGRGAGGGGVMAIGFQNFSAFPHHSRFSFSAMWVLGVVNGHRTQQGDLARALPELHEDCILPGCSPGSLLQGVPPPPPLVLNHPNVLKPKATGQQTGSPHGKIAMRIITLDSSLSRSLSQPPCPGARLGKAQPAARGSCRPGARRPEARGRGVAGSAQGRKADRKDRWRSGG